MHKSSNKEEAKVFLENKKKILIDLGVFIMIVVAIFFIFLDAKKNTFERDKQIILERHLSEKDYLVYGANICSPPLRFLDEDGVYKGVVVDYISLLSLELGVEIKTEPYEWEEALWKLKEGETDFCDMFVNEERAKDYVFTEPIYNLRTVLAVKEKSKFSFKDINEMKIATEKGDYANYYIEKNFPEADLIFVDNVGAGMDLLLQGQVDAVIGDEPIVSYYIGKKSAQIRMINTALYEEPVVLGMPRENADLLPIVNHAIKEVNKKGQLEKIQQKWFGISTPLKDANGAKKYIRLGIISVGALLILVGTIAANNHSLKKQVRIRTRELEASRNELQLIFDSIPEYIFMVDQFGNIVNANKGILEYIGLDRGLCFGQYCDIILHKFSLGYVDIVSEEEVARHEKILVKTGKRIYEVKTYSLTEFERGTLITLRDITLDEVNKKQLLQSSKMLAIGQLAAGMAHQIRNPLSIIRMHTYMLRENQNMGETGKKSLKYIDENVQKAGCIIDNVMNFWRVSGNQIETINLSKNLGDIISLHENLLKKKEIEVEIDCNSELWFRCNEEALKHILVNLVSNAIDAMEHLGRLTLLGEKVEDGVLIQCIDSGCGIAEENMENLFNPFFTTKELGKGTGLGLFVVYSEVEKLSGSIKVESKIGEGTCFTIKLPLGEENFDV
ncbi:transporter substrate-binding domain-containing protein [Anaerotignum sp.]|uniref:transporter substrate-binding domain-containing protein n=1 Tax=Anaerotignum sp. TaxID=2039241 RepID=UPI0027153EDA|nr:transporter substrate-binding domain-containing protein [Anaerotignum sp.]